MVCAACSGGGDSSGYAEELKAFQLSAAARADAVAGPIAAAYVEGLAPERSDDDFLEKVQGEVTGLTRFLCDQIKALGAKAGSGDTKVKRLDDLRVTSEEMVRDGFARALLEKLLAAPAEWREQLLDALGVRATGNDGGELRGTAALQNAGVIDAQGHVAVPARGTDHYTRYERWLSAEAPGLAGTLSKLQGDVRAELDRCSSSA